MKIKLTKARIKIGQYYKTAYYLPTKRKSIETKSDKCYNETKEMILTLKEIDIRSREI